MESVSTQAVSERLERSALAALAAASHGRFEAMHKRLLALEGQLDDAAIARAASEAGLDLTRFEADRKSGNGERVLSRGQAIAERFAVAATPTVFVNGRRIKGALATIGGDKVPLPRCAQHGDPGSDVVRPLAKWPCAVLVRIGVNAKTPRRQKR